MLHLLSWYVTTIYFRTPSFLSRKSRLRICHWLGYVRDRRKASRGSSLVHFGLFSSEHDLETNCQFVGNMVAKVLGKALLKVLKMLLSVPVVQFILPISLITFAHSAIKNKLRQLPSWQKQQNNNLNTSSSNSRRQSFNTQGGNNNAANAVTKQPGNSGLLLSLLIRVGSARAIFPSRISIIKSAWDFSRMKSLSLSPIISKRTIDYRTQLWQIPFGRINYAWCLAREFKS